MAYGMRAEELAEKAREVAENYKTLYVRGCFGAPLTAAHKPRYSKGQSESRQAKIAAATEDTFGFDCVCLIKALLWGWRGDVSAVYGGAKYESNGVPDIGTEEILGVCADVTADFSEIEVGELVWMPGHVGLYVGDGLAVECTSAWADRVQITACNRAVPGYPRRDWTKHGRLPYVRYGEGAAGDTAKPTSQKTEGRKVNIQVTVLKKGAKGSAVKAMQALLNLRTGAGLALDGSFGGATDKALRAYQASRGLAVDGSCGGATWTALLER